jgi:DNA-binding beta-propeller fold protein YncE
MVAVVATVILPVSAQSQAIRGSYIYTLSNFTGPVRQDWSRVSVDRERNEVYALYQNTIHVFNDAAMEVYRFGDDLDLGHILDMAVDERGDVLLLTYRDSKSVIVRCDYRGRPQAEITLQAPSEFGEFVPNRMAYHRGRLYLASTSGLMLAIADPDGNFVDRFDLFRLFELEEKDRGVTELGGFSVDTDGNVLMTVPVLFRAFVLSPKGELASFGKAGGAPGRFNIIGGIARDSKGNLLVVDRLKGSVLVFDRKHQFVTQFASRGYRPGELVSPNDLAIGNGDRVYVTQAGRRGISVFRMTYR